MIKNDLWTNIQTTQLNSSVDFYVADEKVSKETSYFSKTK